MTFPFFSIIIPIYNVEQYLPECIDSVLAQQDIDLEIILVDDNSPDQCPQICDDYARKFKQIKVIHQPNGGVSKARNAGTEIAQGDYILYLDSDDYYDWDTPDALHQLAEICRTTQADYVGFNCQNFNTLTGEKYRENRGVKHKDISVLSGQEVPQYFCQIRNFPGAAWTAALKREFINKNKIRFTEGITSEDIDWLMSIFIAADKYAFCDDLYFVVYRLFRSGSITNIIKPKSINDLLFIIKKWVKILESPQYDSMRKYLNDYLAYHYLSTLILAHFLTKSEKNKFKPEILSLKYMLHDLVRPKVKIAALIYKLMGFELGGLLLYSYHKFLRHK